MTVNYMWFLSRCFVDDLLVVLHWQSSVSALRVFCVQLFVFCVRVLVLHLQSIPGNRVHAVIRGWGGEGRVKRVQYGTIGASV